MTTVLPSFGDQINVVIVGASGGIGRGLAKLLMASDNVSQVYGLSRTPVYLDHPKWRSLSIDLDDEFTISEAASKVNLPIHVVIVTTGLLHDEREQIKPEKSYRQLDAGMMLKNFMINSVGPALIAKYFLPLMSRDRRSFFGALSARVGSISDNRLGGWHSYRASKAALNMLLRNLSIEQQRSVPQLIIAGLHPGTVDTELSKPFQRNVAPEKLFTADFSAARLLAVINGLEPEDSGKCFAWDGQEIIP